MARWAFRMRKLALLSCVGVPILVATGWGLNELDRNRGESLEAAAERFSRCFDAMDSGCMMEYVTDREKQMLNLNEASLGEFLQKFVKPRMSGFKSDSPLNIRERYPAMKLEERDTSRQYRHPDGRVVNVGWHVFTVDGKPKVQLMTATLFYVALQCDYDPKKTFMGNKHQAWHLRASRALPTLTKLQLQGYVQQDGYLSEPQPPTLWERSKAAISQDAKPDEQVEERADWNAQHPAKMLTWSEVVEWHRSYPERLRQGSIRRKAELAEMARPVPGSAEQRRMRDRAASAKATP